MASQVPVPPLIFKQLSHLLSHPSLEFKVDRFASGCKNSAYNDRFSLFVPFCLDYIRWDVIYNAFHPLVPPDVIFAADDETFDPLSMVEREGESARSKRSGLYDWDPRDPSGLLNLILELRDLYALYQRKCVVEIDDERLKFEIDTVLSRKGIEVCLVSSNERVEEVKFAIPLLLDMDFNVLIHGCPWKGKQNIYLQAIFPIKKYSSIPSTPRLRLFPFMELSSLLSIEDIKLPTWIEGMCMAEYVPTLEDTIRLQLVDSIAAIGLRRRFIEALVPFFGRPVEADPVFCRKATVFSGSATFSFLVHFSLSTRFPTQQPVLTLQSCMNSNNQGAPIMSHHISDYPWSPRWDAPHMVERIYNFLADECLGFKRYCMESTSTAM